jgi:hypothetical protein
MQKARSISDLKILDGYTDFSHMTDTKKRRLLEQIFAKIGRLAKEWKDNRCPITEPEPPEGLYCLMNDATPAAMAEIRRMPEVQAWVAARHIAAREIQEWEHLQPDYHCVILQLIKLLVKLADGQISTDRALVELLAMDYG